MRWTYRPRFARPPRPRHLHDRRTRRLSAASGRSRPSHLRIADDRRIELRTGVPEDRVGDPDPVSDIAIVEVHIGRSVEECMEAEVRIRHIEAGLAAVADHFVFPRDWVAIRLPVAV